MTNFQEWLAQQQLTERYNMTSVQYGPADTQGGWSEYLYGSPSPGGGIGGSGGGGSNNNNNNNG